jgi:hypothetical protein
MKRSLVLFLFIGFFSCSDVSLFENVPYYSFDKEAKLWLSKIIPNDTLRFLGSDGKIVNFYILRKEINKEVNTNCGTTLLGYHCANYYYYDEIYLVYKRLDGKFSDHTEHLRMTMRLDSNVNKKNIPRGTIAKASLQGEFYGFNSKYDFPTMIFPDLYSIKKFETFTNQKRTYKNVITINSGSKEPIINRWFPYQRNISEVKFDLEYGFVYFKNLDGLEWKRIN